MLKESFNYTPPAALGGSLRDYRYPRGADLQGRIEGFFKWQNLRRQHGLWPFSRAAEGRPGPVAAVCDDAGGRFSGVNFASQDYLGLSSHPAIKAAALEAIEAFGVYSAGSPNILGAATPAVALEQKLADVLGMQDALLFPTGWAAAYGAIKGLVRPADHVVMDALVHGSLQEGAAAATRNLYLFRHGVVDECRRWLESIRAKDADNGVMVVTEALFSLDSDTPDLAALQALCEEFGATLLVDVTHDLGVLGADGTGVVGDLGLLGKLDLVVGSFAATLASNGGFVACRNREVKEYLRFFSSPCAASSALSPVQAATVLKAFEIVESPEGQQLRDRLMSNAVSLRRRLAEAGFEAYGDPSPIVCVKLGSESLARLVSRRLQEAGVIVSLMEFPAVPKGQARVRLQLMAGHTEDNLRDAVAALKAAHEAGLKEVRWLENERDKVRVANG
jgi:glycine C-acetyltransferase